MLTREKSENSKEQHDLVEQMYMVKGYNAVESNDMLKVSEPARS